MIHPTELAALDRLSTNSDFTDLSVAALLYECVRSGSVRQTDTIFKYLKADFEAKTVDEKLKALFIRRGMGGNEPS
jgi:hypothetical protein